MIFTTIIVGVLLIIGSIIMFPERWAPSLYPTYIETIEANWNLSLPIPDSEKDIYSSRGSHGDGDAITELHYNNPMDIQKIKELSNYWVSGEELNITEIPSGVQELIRDIDKSSSYFYLHKNSYDYIFFKLNGNMLTIYESYI